MRRLRQHVGLVGLLDDLAKSLELRDVFVACEVERSERGLGLRSTRRRGTLSS